MSTEDNIRKSTENLDEAAGGAPSNEFLQKVDATDFGTTDEAADESEDNEATEGDRTADEEGSGERSTGDTSDDDEDHEESRG